jgi:hypothetical protein
MRCQVPPRRAVVHPDRGKRLAKFSINLRIQALHFWDDTPR